MTEKEQLISAFQSLDFEALSDLLDDNKSYMDVPKKTFLNALRKEVESHEGLKKYDTVLKGNCNYCNKGCIAYKFKTENQPSLNLFFEENKGRVSDIYLCHDLKVDVPDENKWDIYFNFYEEEKVNFEPSLNYNINLQKVEKSIEDFNSLTSIGLVPIQDVVNWFEKQKSLATELKLNDPFAIERYKAFEEIDSLYREVSYLVHNYTMNNLAQKALGTYNKIDKKDEKSIVKWLIANKDNYFFSLKKTDNWKRTGIIILETKPNIVVDCSDYLDSFLFDDIYYNHHNKIMTKYKPTKEHYEQNGGSVTYSLETYLSLHKKYLDLL